MTRIPFKPRISANARVALARQHQRGGTLPGVQYGTGFFGSLLSGLKKVALPALKTIDKAALPMAQEAITAGLTAKGPLKQRLKKAAQSATRKQNLIGLAKAGASGMMARPF